MASASGYWFLDGRDVFDTYGLVVVRGNSEFLAFPEMKERLSYDWAERNGVDIDLTQPRFKSKEVKMLCSIIADNHTAFWQQRNAFFNDLAILPGWKTWRITDHDKDYSIRYVKTDNSNLITRRLKNTEKIAFSFTLEIEVNETLVVNDTVSTDPVYVRDKDGNLIGTLAPGSTYIVDTCDILFNGVYERTILPGQSLDIISPYSKSFKVVI